MDISNCNQETGVLDCGICNKELSDDKRVKTNCGHDFCTECFFKWLHENSRCALCRNLFIKTKEEVLSEKVEQLSKECEEIATYRDLIISQIEEEKEKYAEIYENHVERLQNSYNKMKAYKENLNDIKILYKTEEERLRKLKKDIVDLEKEWEYKKEKEESMKIKRKLENERLERERLKREYVREWNTMYQGRNKKTHSYLSSQNEIRSSSQNEIRTKRKNNIFKLNLKLR